MTDSVRRGKPSPVETPEPPGPPATRRQTTTRGAIQWIWAGAWRFGLAGPPIGAAVVLLPAVLTEDANVLQASSDLMAGWLLFSIFAYGFSAPSAIAAGALFGLTKYRTGHSSRWRLGALTGTLGWLAQIGITAAWMQDAQSLNAVLFLPIAVIAGALCGRLFIFNPYGPPVSSP